MAKLSKIWPKLGSLMPEITEQLEIDGQYSGYIQRQEIDIKSFRKDEALKLPTDLNYNQVKGLSAEVKTKLGEVRPATLGAAARISGVTPVALTALLGHTYRDAAPEIQ